MRRGFKTEANDIAREVRKELRLRLADPLDAFKLAEHLAIPVLPLSEFRQACPSAVRHFSIVETGAFSGLTVFRGPRRLIVYNDAHAPQRRASNVAHELAHALLMHPPTAALDHRGCRHWDGDMEEEANWLAGALLISDEAAISVVRRGLTLEGASATYGVSRPMMQFRLNVTGARKRVQRGRMAVVKGRKR